MKGENVCATWYHRQISSASSVQYFIYIHEENPNGV